MQNSLEIASFPSLIYFLHSIFFLITCIIVLLMLHNKVTYIQSHTQDWKIYLFGMHDQWCSWGHWGFWVSTHPLTQVTHLGLIKFRSKPQACPLYPKPPSGYLCSYSSGTYGPPSSLLQWFLAQSELCRVITLQTPSSPLPLAHREPASLVSCTAPPAPGIW